jgi:hypothetical protein
MEAVVSWFEALSRLLPAGTEETPKNFSQNSQSPGIYSKHSSLEYKLKAISVEPAYSMLRHLIRQLNIGIGWYIGWFG